LRHHGARERGALTLSAGELGGPPLQQAGQIEPRRRVVHIFVDRPPDRARAGQQGADERQALGRPQPPHGERQSDILRDGHVGIERIGLEHHGDVAGARPQLIDHLAAYADAAAVLCFQARNDAQQCGLAAAGRAEQRHERAVRHVEAHATQNIGLSEALGDLVDNNACHPAYPAFRSFAPMRYICSATHL
jgi:hypothetical protein